MKRKYRIDRIIICIFIIILIITGIVLLINKLTTKEEYSIKYTINDTKIKEKYNKETKSYYYNLTYNSLSYDFIYKSDYLEERKLINGIKKYKEENSSCIVVESEYIKIHPLCQKDNKVIDYHLIDNNLKEKLSKYFTKEQEEDIKLSNYKIYNTKDNKVIWNYNGINYIKNNKLEKIEIFKKDIYDVSISALINNYFIIADYNQEYSFSDMYIVDLNTKEITKWYLNSDISFDSYIIGTKDKSVYLIDKKNKVEYELVPHKQKLRIVSKSNKGLLYENGKETYISMNQLSSKNYKFNNSLYNYKIENKTIYLYYENPNIKTKISNQKIDKIVYQKEDNIYYLVGTTLYRYNIKYGEVKIMEYEEWKYNNTNVIFIE